MLARDECLADHAARFGVCSGAIVSYRSVADEEAVT